MVHKAKPKKEKLEEIVNLEETKLVETEAKLKEAEAKLDKAKAELKEAEAKLDKAKATPDSDLVQAVTQAVAQRNTCNLVYSTCAKFYAAATDTCIAAQRAHTTQESQLEKAKTALLGSASVGSAVEDIFTNWRELVGSPSKFGKYPEVLCDMSDVYFHRSPECFNFRDAVPPIVLGSEIMNKFVSMYESNLNRIENWSSEKETALNATVQAMKQVYSKEEERKQKFIDSWSDLFGKFELIPNQNTSNHSSSSVGTIDIMDKSKTLIFEVKNENVNINSEAFTEGVGYFIQSSKEAEVNERLIITLIGSSITVYGAVFSSTKNKLVIQPLIRSIIFCKEYTNECRALLQALHDTILFVSNTKIDKRIKYPDFAVSAGTYDEWTWIGNKSICYKDGICLKYCYKPLYHIETHEYFTENRWAPKISKSFVVGNWKVIQMKHLADYAPINLDSDSKYSDEDKTALKEALTELLVFIEGNSEYVHGDLRAPNILVKFEDDQAHLQVIDFEWSGKAGEVYYPPNIYLPSFNVLGRADIGPCLPISRDHDIAWIKYIITRFV